MKLASFNILTSCDALTIGQAQTIIRMPRGGLVKTQGFNIQGLTTIWI
jgi:hypothetical protein